MLIPAVTYLAIRCPNCGRLQGKQISVFACGGGREAELGCSCHGPLATYSYRDSKTLNLRYHCIMCEGQHLVQLRKNQVWSDTLTALSCETTGLEVGFIGSRAAVREATHRQEKSLRELVQDLGFSDYFTNPKVMCQVLQYLHHLAISGNLYCHCGNNDIEVEIFPDHLELHCPECEASGPVMAQAKEDLVAVRKIGEIELIGRGFRCRRIQGNRRRSGHSNKKQ